MSVSHSLLNNFPKEKNRKKRKPFKQGGQAERPKGNGISPEGWRSHYAVVFWSGGCGGCPLYLCYLFVLFWEMVL
ncbi:hypothetical protein B0A81_04325 [Flavobacterium plurextorum]|uniref:Uncharacterized protein n=1 Tax=Flavobacterium plurextorum TaxID=1114867 RepID=A0ABX4CXW6_9FLAO|nr:hypothetical protein [Flavobacterium plurextorum]OXB10237.1 hypothetical protein B0A81_04325 [Flavobacterium plurextorum]